MDTDIRVRTGRFRLTRGAEPVAATPVSPDLLVLPTDPADAESTITQRNIHRIEAGSPYSELVRQAAFIVQLWTTEGSQFAGLVEDVDTGKQVKFLREQELLDFLRERFRPDTAEQRTKGRNG
jgi:hypothetical protein